MRGAKNKKFRSKVLKANEAHPIEIRHLKIFVAVYNHRSFTRAAEQLFTSQPTISEHIKNLEERLRCNLFDRLGRTILPTAEAETLYPRAVSILEDLENLVDEIASTGKSVSGKLLIGASTIPGAYILPKLAAAFKDKYPNITFEIRINDSTKIVQGVQDNELFIGIVGAKISSKKLRYHPLTNDELILVAATDNRLSEKISLEQLSDLPFIMRETGSGTRRSIESLLEQQHFPADRLNICATLGSSTAVKEAIKADLGVSIISRCGVQDELAAGSLKEIRVINLTMQRAFFFVTSKKRTLPHHYAEFLEQTIKEVAKEEKSTPEKPEPPLR